MSSDKKRIGLVTWDYAQPRGGMGRSLQWIADALRADGQEIIVASPSSADPQDRIGSLSGRFGGQILFSLFLPFMLHGWIRKRKIESLIIPVGPGGVLLFLRPRVPVTVITYHTYEQQSRLVPGQWWKKIFIPFERRAMLRAMRILTFCSDTHAMLVNRYALPAEKIRLLPHAIDIDAWQPSQTHEKGLCVCVARLEKRKGVEKLIKAWPLVIKEVPDARLVIVGEGIGASSIDRTINRIGQSVRRIGSLPFDELRALVGRADVAVCPSYLEGYGLAAAEAMAAGVAVVATDCEGLRSLIKHDETGLLIRTDDTDNLARGIIRLLQQDGLRERLARNARVFIRTECDPVRATKALQGAAKTA
jgi:glycosyltransferase involved in cell wall biosynthesis